MWLLGIFSKRISDIESLTEQKAFNSYTYSKNLYINNPKGKFIDKFRKI